MPDIPVWQDMEFTASHARDLLLLARDLTQPMIDRLAAMEYTPWESSDYARDRWWAGEVADYARVALKLLKQLSDEMPDEWVK